MRRNTITSVLANFDVSTECWLWKGYLNPEGYGEVSFDGRPRRVYRLVYEALVGPIPKGMSIDHECHNRDSECSGGRTCIHRRCGNPAHLSVKPIEQNVSDRARLPRPCRYGHDVSERVRNKRGDWACRACQRIAGAKNRRKNGMQERRAT